MTAWNFVHANDIHLGTPRSYRYDPSRNHNWAIIRKQMAALKPDLLLMGGDLTRDGDTHEYEYQMCKDDLETLPFAYFVIPGNMDVGNKRAVHPTALPSRDNEPLDITAQRLGLFSCYFGPINWTFVHRNIRFTGFFAAVAGSGLPQEQHFWHFIERLASLPATRHHVVMTHYPLFLNDVEEDDFDSSDPQQYILWYSSIDKAPRMRILTALKAAGVDIVLSGHLHCRWPVQVVDGIRLYKTPSAGGHGPRKPRWSAADSTIGFFRFDVGEDGIEATFVPCGDHQKSCGYGPDGHPPIDSRNYDLAQRKPPLKPDCDQ